jgi:hypothetical protein
MKKPTALDPQKVAANQGESPHLRLSPAMGPIPTLVDISSEMLKTLGPSPDAFDDAIKL